MVQTKAFSLAYKWKLRLIFLLDISVLKMPIRNVKIANHQHQFHTGQKSNFITRTRKSIKILPGGQIIKNSDN